MNKLIISLVLLVILLVVGLKLNKNTEQFYIGEGESQTPGPRQCDVCNTVTGPAGEPGSRGDSAFNVAVAIAPTGESRPEWAEEVTESNYFEKAKEWVDSLTGTLGPQGPSGPVGPRGPEGATGLVGPQGPTAPASTVVRVVNQRLDNLGVVASSSDDNQEIPIGQPYGMVPVGTIVMWSGLTDSLPSGWKLCNGTFYKTGQSPQRFNSDDNDREEIGRMIGDGWYFAPDLENRFIRSGIRDGAAQNTKDGNNSVDVTIGANNLPSHTHTINKNEFNHTHGNDTQGKGLTDFNNLDLGDIDRTDHGHVIPRALNDDHGTCNGTNRGMVYNCGSQEATGNSSLETDGNGNSNTEENNVLYTEMNRFQGVYDYDWGSHHRHPIPNKDFGDETVTTSQWPAEQPQPQALRINIEPAFYSLAFIMKIPPNSDGSGN